MTALVRVEKDLLAAKSALGRVHEAVLAFVPSAENVEDARKLVALAKATEKLAAAVKGAKELHCESGELIVESTTKLAEAEALERAARPKGRRKKVPSRGTIPRQQIKSESRRAKLPQLAPEEREAYFDACRQAETPPTVTGATQLARLDPPKRKEVLAKLADIPDVRKAVAEIKREEKHKLAVELDAKPVPQPTGRFDVIVIDPPWRYDKRAEDVTHRGRNQYPDMTIEEICAVPVGERAADHCVLWLWTTNAFMRDAYRCIDAWGFTEKTILTWGKDRMGTGDWLRGKTEHCIMAVRGKPLVTLTNQTTLLVAPLREHSRKPDEFYELVESLCHGSKLEMFSREQRDGWAAWGAETENF